jgi:hypothetical protein
VPRPVDMPVRVFQIAVFALWLSGLPFLIAGIVQSSATMVRFGATLLFASLIVGTIHEAAILKIIWSYRS